MYDQRQVRYMMSVLIKKKGAHRSLYRKHNLGKYRLVRTDLKIRKYTSELCNFSVMSVE